MRFKRRINKLKKAILKKPYIYSFVLTAIGYLILNIIVNKIYITAPVLLTYNLKIVIPYLFFTLLVALLVALNVNLIALKFKELKKLNGGSGLTFVGIFGGVLGGACPSCFVGLFPAFLGLFGVTVSLSSLPLFGLEIQIGSTILLLISVFYLTKDNVCKIKKK